MKRALMCCVMAAVLVPVLALGAVTRIEQVVEGNSALKLYVSAESDTGASIVDMKQEELGLTLDNTPLKVESIKLFSQTGEGMAITLLLDCSKSMGSKGEGEQEPFAMAKEAARRLINGMGPKDTFSILAVGDTVKVVQPFTSDKALLGQSLNSIKPTANLTMLYEALRKAIELNAQSGVGIPERRAVIVISDGKDEGSGITLDDVLESNKRSGLPFFAIGFTRVEPAHLSNLKRLALKSGGLYVASPTAKSITKALPAIKEYFRNSYTVQANASGPLAAKLSVLKASFERGGVRAESVRDIQLAGKAAYAPGSEQAGGGEKGIGGFLRAHKIASSAALAVVVLLVILGVVVSRRRKARIATEAARVQAEAMAAARSSAPPAAEQSATSAGRSIGKLCVVASTVDAVPVGLSFPLQASNILGRGEGSSIILNDAKASRRHCEVTVNNGMVMVTDLGSTNGTKVNGTTITSPTVLRGGEQLSIGGVEMRFDQGQSV